VVGGWELHVLATILVACAVASYFSAGSYRDRRVRFRLSEPDIHLLPQALTLGLSMLLILVSVSTAIVIWLG